MSGLAPKNLYVIKEIGPTLAGDYYWSQRDECWTGVLAEATQYGSREYAYGVLTGIERKHKNRRYRVEHYQTELGAHDMTAEEREEETRRRQEAPRGYTAAQSNNLGKPLAAV